MECSGRWTVREGVSNVGDQRVKFGSAAEISAPRGGVEYQILENKIWKKM